MSEYQRETAFLRQVIAYDDTNERHRLEERITQAQGNERCVRRAVWLMILFTALAVAGLAAVFPADFSQNKSEFIVKVLCALGLGSLISLPAFAACWVVHRKELDRRREECRQLVSRLLETRLGKPCTTPPAGNGASTQHPWKTQSFSELLTTPGGWRRNGENDFEKQLKVTVRKQPSTNQ